MKYYKISEGDLKGLLVDSLELCMLNRDGVDNWTWYGESYRELIKEYIPDANEDTDFSDVAEMLLKDYEVINE